MEHPRVAVFDKWLVMRWQHPGPDVPSEDSPDMWASALEPPELTEGFFSKEQAPEYEVSDERAMLEVARVLHHKSCAICRGPMVMRNTWIEDEQIFVCCSCGYWAGVGFREWNMHHHMYPLRSAIGRYFPLQPLDSMTSDFLVTHLRRSPQDMTSLSPNRAEKFVADLLADALDCEVRHVGQPGDGGVDAYVVRSNEIRSIVQVKWHRDIAKAESVSVVREVAGTLLAEGVPDGIVVSNRTHFSPAARSAARKIEGRKVDGVGSLRVQLADYHLIVDMLDLATRRLSADMEADDWFPVEAHEECCVFDGAARIGHSTAQRWGSVP